MGLISGCLDFKSCLGDGKPNGPSWQPCPTSTCLSCLHPPKHLQLDANGEFYAESFWISLLLCTDRSNKRNIFQHYEEWS